MSKNEIIQMLEKMPDNASEFDILKKVQEIILIKNDLKESRENIENGDITFHDDLFDKYQKWILEK